MLAQARLYSYLPSSFLSAHRTTTEPVGDGKDAELSPLPPLGGVRRISSASNPFVKHCVKLRQSSSYRRSCRSALVVGLTPILEICRFNELKHNESSLVDCLLLLDGMEAPKELQDFIIIHVSQPVMKKVSGMQSVDCITAIAIMKIPTCFFDMGEKQEDATFQCMFHSPHRILVLDGIQDPGNLGTLIRSAMAFRWDGAFLLPGCCDPFNEKALRAARGASFQLPIASGNWFHLEALITARQMKMLAGHPSNDRNGSTRQSSLSREFADELADKPLCLVLGSEGNGLSEQTLNASILVSIPMEGMFESLNVSVAGGIFLYMLQPENRRR